MGIGLKIGAISSLLGLAACAAQRLRSQSPTGETPESLNEKFTAHYKQLAQKHQVDEDVAASVLESLDNGNLLVEEEEFKKADAALRAYQTGPAKQPGNDFYHCFSWSRGLMKIEDIERRRLRFYDALIELQNHGYRLIGSRQVTQHLQQNYDRKIARLTVDVQFKPTNNKEACSVASWYEIAFEKAGRTYATHVPNRENFEIPGDRALQLLSNMGFTPILGR